MDIPISILLPFRNMAEWLPACLDSLLTQSMPDFEVVAVDDGSSDASADIVSARAQTDSRIRLLRQDACGLVAALNAGLDQCRGEWIARMDADDRCHPDRLREQRAYAARHPEIELIGTQVSFDGDAEAAAGYAHYVDWQNRLVEPEDIALSRFQESPLAHPSVMFHRSLPTRFGGYRDGPFPEDYECWLRWMDAGVHVGKVEQVLVYWRDRPDRLSRADERYAVDAFHQIKAKYLAHWLSQNNPHHPQIYLWGAGKRTRKRARYLLEQGITCAAYVDLDPTKIGRTLHGIPVITPEQLPPPGQAFIVPYVARRHVPEQIRSWLETHGHQRGIDFISAG